MSFIIRTTKPGRGNKYYIRKANGGYSDAIKGYPTDAECDVLSNCVGYAYGRFNEIGGYGYCKYLAPVNAENFMAFKGDCKSGYTPKPGACMVWRGGRTFSGSDGAGHVAIVERVISENEVYTSESGYGYKAFWNQIRRIGEDGNWGEDDLYTFLGFIYNPAVGDESAPYAEIDEKEQKIIRVTTPELHIREYPSLTGEITSYADEGRYVYTETKENDGYTWYKIGEKQWIAYDPTWAVIEKNEDAAPTVAIDSVVSIRPDATYYDGKTMPKWVKERSWIVKAVYGDRAFIDKSVDGVFSINSPVNVKYLVAIPREDLPEDFVPYKVKVCVGMLNIRGGAGTNFRIEGCIIDKGVYTIVAESDGVGAEKWGKLRSGLGWISLDFTERVYEND